MTDDNIKQLAQHLADTELPGVREPVGHERRLTFFNLLDDWQCEVIPGDEFGIETFTELLARRAVEFLANRQQLPPPRADID